MKAKKLGWRYFLAVFAILIAAFGIIVVGGHYRSQGVLLNALRELEEAKSLTETPTTCQHGCLCAEWRSIKENMPDVPSAARNVFDFPWDGDILDLAGFFAEQKEFYASLLQIADDFAMSEWGIPQCIGHISQTGTVQRFGQLLLIYAIAASKEGDTDRALNALHAGLHVSGTLLTSQTRSILMVQVKMDTAFLLAYRDMLKNESCADIRFSMFSGQRSYRRALRDAMFTDEYRFIWALSSAADDEMPRYLPRIFYAETINNLMANGFRDLIMIINYYSNEEHIQNPKMNVPILTPLGNLVHLGLEEESKNIAKAELLARLAALATNLRLNRVPNQPYPEEVKAPSDPFTGMPIHYQREGDGFMLIGGRTESPLIWKWAK